MNRRERLTRTLRGEPVDRPAVSFYEIGMRIFDTDNPDRFNIYNHPSWQPLIDIAESRTDIMRDIAPVLTPKSPDVHNKYCQQQQWIEGDHHYTRLTITTGQRQLTQLQRRDADVDTVWTLEHLLKDADDVRAYLDIPDEVFEVEVDCSTMAAQVQAIGDAGIGLINCSDPICSAASMFDMDVYTVMAYTEQELFHELLAKAARINMPRYEQIARECPGQLWRICGPEYASEPYLPPALFDEYVIEYDRPLIHAIKRDNGFARLHSHGRLKNILPLIAKLDIDGLDPIEPTPQGDVTLIDVRREYGDKWVLFGNIEISDLENMEPAAFKVKVEQALEQGTHGPGRGFVLMPSACPYGRIITERTLANYMTMLHLAENYHSCWSPFKAKEHQV